MAAYIRSWLPSSLTSTTVTSTESTNSTDAGPEVNIVQHEEEDDNGSDTEKEDNDIPPVFPAISSAQRLSSNTASPELKSNAKGIPKFLTDTQLMPPPPIPGPRIPGVSASSASSSLAVPASASSSLAVPPTTTKPPTQLGVQKSKKREKVALAPGHSPLDWAALKSSGQDLRGVDALMRITPSVLKQHNKRDDAWSAFNGKVYNITPYLPFHPGGEKELMRVAGRDGTKLFALTHAWVNVDFMLDSCLVGFLVPEPSS